MSPYKSQSQFFIYCVGQCPKRIKSFRAYTEEHGIPAKSLLGRYEGQDEQSFVSRMSDFELILPWLIAEKSILKLVDFDIRNQPSAILHHLRTGAQTPMGKMIQVSEDEALACTSFSYDPQNGLYFVCENTRAVDQNLNQ